MYRLRVFGGLALEAGQRVPEGAATRRRRPLALLAILAAAGESGIARDKLLLYLWPESNTRRARNSLHQTLYSVRRELGQDAVAVGTPNVQLNRALFSSDLWDFEAALSRGALEDAIALYSGPFLDGFTLPDLREFERWVEEERARLARRYTDAAEALAAQATRQGHHRLAVERWQALARLDPLSSRPALGLMSAFVAAGNRASALEYARDYQALIHGELGAAPDPVVTAFVEELRREHPEQVRPGHAADKASLTLPSPSRQETAWVAPSPLAEPAASHPLPREVVAAEPAQTALQRRRITARPLWPVGLLLLVLAVAGAVGTWWIRQDRAHQPTSPGLVAVLPFTVVGSDEVQYLSTGLVDLLTTNLEGAGEIRSADPQAVLGWLSKRGISIQTPEEAEDVAARFGAGLYVLGNVVESGGRLRLRAAMYDRRRPGAPVASAAVEGEGADLFGMVDQLTTQLLAAGRHGPRERLARVAAATTSSVEALKSYLVGERELRSGRYVSALDAFQRAVAVDTSFALAYYRLSITAERIGQDSLAQRAAESAARLDGRLSEHDRLVVRALVAWREGRSADAERLYRRVVDDYPDDVEAWFQLGQVLFHSNPLRGRSSVEARGAFEHVLALDPDNEEALVHLARIASIEGRRQDVDTLMQRVLALAPSIEVLELRAFRAFALGDREAHKRVTRELLRNPPAVPSVTALQVAVYLDDLEGTEHFAQLLKDPRYSDHVRGLAYRLLARVAVARGQWSVARVQLDTAQQFDSTAALELRSLLAVLPFLRVPRSELLAIREAVEAWPAGIEGPGEVSHSAAHAGLHPYVRRYRLGLLSVQLGDTLEALRHARALDRSSDSSQALKAEALHTFARSIRARVAMQGRRPAEALAHLEGANWEMVESIFEAEALDRYYRAELLHALGRSAEALDWYGTIAQRATYELVYVAPARWREAEIHERAGDRAKAVECYQEVTRLWRNADPPLQATVAEASQRLRKLGDVSLKNAGVGAAVQLSESPRELVLETQQVAAPQGF